MSKIREDKWREDFEKEKPFQAPLSVKQRIQYKDESLWLERDNKGKYCYMHVQVAWVGYVSGRQKAQEEIDRLNKIIEILGNTKNWGNHKGVDCYLFSEAERELLKLEVKND